MATSVALAVVTAANACIIHDQSIACAGAEGCSPFSIDSPASSAITSSTASPIRRGLSAGPGATTVTVHVYGSDFSINPFPFEVVDPIINVGDTIHWVWDASLHTVQSVQGSTETYASGLLFQGATFDHTFNTAGTFAYYCGVHGFDNGNGTADGMAGTITVLPVPEPASASVVGLPAGVLIMRRSRRS